MQRPLPHAAPELEISNKPGNCNCSFYGLRLSKANPSITLPLHGVGGISNIVRASQWLKLSKIYRSDYLVFEGHGCLVWAF